MRRYTSETATFDEETGTNYLVSMSDLMSGLLFLFIITLMTFAMDLIAGISVSIASTAFFRTRPCS